MGSVSALGLSDKGQSPACSTDLFPGGAEQSSTPVTLRRAERWALAGDTGTTEP